MRPRELQFDFINRNCVEFRGFGARELYVGEYKRPPVYNTRTKSWVTTPDRARDLAALAESRGWLVTFSGSLEDGDIGLPVGWNDVATLPVERVVEVDELREVGLW